MMIMEGLGMVLKGGLLGGLNEGLTQGGWGALMWPMRG
jgi:hypothetical protein